jgi:ubiquinone/menaquinone biosynthesis C-methylase UbiE
MERVPEPELMDDAAQAWAYAHADFSAPHVRFIELFREVFPNENIRGAVLDLGCGPADIAIRFALAYPECVVDGVDGAEAMLACGRARLAAEGLGERVRLFRAYLPGAQLPAAAYEALISNSLLHHMRQPTALWETVKRCARPGAPLFVMDLSRPASREQAALLVEEYAADEPPVLRHDFFHSLLAAYRPGEVEAQLRLAGLASLTVEAVSDRHLLIYGRMP